ncbi:MAG: aminotransferase class IV [Dongiaceae bacterium]
MALANERVAYFNGKFVPESDVLIPFRDRGFMAGDAAFDTARTFGHRIFKLKEHIDRLYRSLRYLQIDPQIPAKELTAITEEVVARNLHLIDADEDYWVSQRVSRGLNSADRSPQTKSGPTVIVECQPLPLKQRARLYRDGIDVIVPSVRRAAPDMLSPRAKTHNYLNLIMGDLEAKAADPESWAILLDANGNLCEGTGSNIFIVRGGTVMTPKARYVLPGISRETVIDLAREIGQPLVEADIDLYDAYTADEAFLTSTSLCICPVRSINGRHVAADAIPGPATQRLIDAYAGLLDFDFVAQYRRRLVG